jgi:methionyl-tRNA synthetase
VARERAPEGPKALDRILGVLVRLLARTAVLLGPALPTKAAELWRTLGGPGSVHDQRLETLPSLDPAGWRVCKAAPLFPR